MPLCSYQAALFLHKMLDLFRWRVSREFQSWIPKNSGLSWLTCGFPWAGILPRWARYLPGLKAGCYHQSLIMIKFFVLPLYVVFKILVAAKF